MSTRIYFPASGTPPLASLAYDSGWNKTSQATRILGSRAKQNTAFTTRTMLSSATNPEFHCSAQYQIAGLLAQTISGTIKGQLRGSVNNVAYNGTIALACRVVSSDGLTLRGTLLAPVAADDPTAPPTLTATNTNRAFRDASENATISLSSVVCSANDVLIVEIGARDADAGTSRSATIHVGDPTVTGDLPEDETTTTLMCGWVEFSGNILLTGDISLAALVMTHMRRRRN